MGRLVGIDTWWTTPPALAWDRRPGIELEEKAGVVASPEYTESLGGTWYEGNILSVAIGQENTQVTPIQLANYIATLVNGGTRYSTHLLKEVKSNDFSQSHLHLRAGGAQATIEIQDENLDAVKAGMLALTTEGSVSTALPGPPRPGGRQDGLRPGQRPDRVQRRLCVLRPL